MAQVPAFSRAASSLKLSQAPLPGEDISIFSVLPNGEGVVYMSGDNFRYPTDVFVVPINGGASTLLSGTLARTYGSRGFMVAPDSGTVLLWINIHGDSNYQDLYHVPITGGTPVPLIERQVPGQPNLYNLVLHDFDASGSQLIYQADYSNSFPAKDELYSIPTAGGAPTKVSSPLAAGESILESAPSFYFSGDKARVVYGVSTTQNSYVGKLISTPTVGGTSATLTDGIAPVFNQNMKGVLFTPDGSKVVFDTDRAVYVNSVTGGTPERLSPLFASNASIQTVIAPNGGSVVYRSFNDIYSVPITGGTPIQLRDSTTSSLLYAVSPDSTRVLFRDSSLLYSVPTSGGASTQLSQTAVDNARLVNSPEGLRALYVNSLAGGGDIFSVKLDGSDRVKLNAAPTGTFRIDPGPLTTPDGRFVIYGLDYPGASEIGWYAVPIEGGTPVLVTHPLPNNFSIRGVSLTPDGSKLVYMADQDTHLVRELYVSGIPLAHVGLGDDVAGSVLGGVGFGGGLGFQFDHIASAGTLTAEFFRTPFSELGSALAGSLNFALPGDVMQLWDLHYSGIFSDSVRLTFTYDQALLRPGVSEDGLVIMHQLAGGGWEELAVLARDSAANTITVEARSFSNFTMGYVPEPSSFVLMALAAGGLLLRRRSRHR